MLYFIDNASNVDDNTVEPETSRGSVPCKLPHTKTMAYTVLYNTGIDFRNAVSQHRFLVSDEVFITDLDGPFVTSNIGFVLYTNVLASDVLSIVMLMFYMLIMSSCRLL